MNNNSSIGIFDSGLGGLTVLNKIQELMPQENYIYFGDTAHLPYGSKSNECIIEYSKKIAQFLIAKNVKAIIIACNSAASVAFETIKKLSNIPIFEVITPSIIESIKLTNTNEICIIGTKTTINSKIYSKKIYKLNPKINTLEIACPLFVPIIEEGLENTKIAYEVGKLYLEKIADTNIDTIILGCTHYKIIINTLKKILPSNIKFIASGLPLAQHLYKHCNNKNKNNKGTTKFYVSDNPKKFKKFAVKFLNNEVINTKCIELL